MTLYDIFMDIAHVENGLAYGDIQFSYDNLMSAMKPGHPADILDDIFGEIGNKLYLDPDASIDIDSLETVLRKMKEFKSCFKIKEIGKPMNELQAYINARKAESEKA